MKNLIMTTTALVLSAGVASADMLFCERDITLANGVDGSSLTFYAHGCDRFQYQPLSERQVLNLGEHCSVESNSSGGFFEEEIEEEYVTVEYGVADGSSHSRDNLTSMGNAASDGDAVLRVRLADAGAVTIRRAGGGTVFSGNLGAGDTFLDFPQGGTYIAQMPQRTRVKATGPHTFNDLGTRTVTVITEIPENENVQPGPRTDRCGMFGEVIPPLN